MTLPSCAATPTRGTGFAGSSDPLWGAIPSAHHRRGASFLSRECWGARPGTPGSTSGSHALTDLAGTVIDLFPGRICVSNQPSRFLPNTPCWNWTGTKDRGGYGIVVYERRPWRVHRLSYWLRHGDLRGKRCVCHTCDNPPCCNPDHLFLGTDSENAFDRIKWSGTLTPEHLEAIRASTLPDRVLARKFRITPNQVQMIRPHFRALPATYRTDRNRP